MKKVLGICEKPSISVYAHHGYINAIMQNEEHTNDVLYSLLIQNFENQNWTFDGEDTKLCIKSSHQIIKSKKYSRNNEAFLIRNCNAVDEICVEIEYLMLYSQMIIIENVAKKIIILLGLV